MSQLKHLVLSELFDGRFDRLFVVRKKTHNIINLIGNILSKIQVKNFECYSSLQLKF